ncbi:unnamed protein product, partial [Iphiclides podalirius]
MEAHAHAIGWARLTTKRLSVRRRRAPAPLGPSSIEASVGVCSAVNTHTRKAPNGERCQARAARVCVYECGTFAVHAYTHESAK